MRKVLRNLLTAGFGLSKPRIFRVLKTVSWGRFFKSQNNKNRNCVALNSPSRALNKMSFESYKYLGRREGPRGPLDAVSDEEAGAVGEHVRQRNGEVGGQIRGGVWGVSGFRIRGYVGGWTDLLGFVARGGGGWRRFSCCAPRGEGSELPVPRG